MSLSGTARDTDAGRLELTVSALFADPIAVDGALTRLYVAGIPRDLIEVVVSPGAAERHYGGKARATKHEAFRFAGIGGVVGVIVGALIGLGVIAWPGFAESEVTAIVQLIGPNAATVGGAIIGAIIGAFIPRKPETRHARVHEAADAIVVVVRVRDEAQGGAVADGLRAAGGREPRMEQG